MDPPDFCYHDSHHGRVKEGEGAAATVEDTARALGGCLIVHEAWTTEDVKEDVKEDAEDVAAAQTFAAERRNDGEAVSLPTPFPPSIQVRVGGHMPRICLSPIQPAGTFPLKGVSQPRLLHS